MSKVKMNQAAVKAVETPSKPMEQVTITLKTYQLFDTLNAAHTLLRLPLSFGTHLKLRKLIRAIEPTLRDVQSEQEALIEAHAKKDEKGNIIRNDKDQIQFEESYRKPNQELMNTNTEITAMPIKASDFGKAEDVDDKQMGLHLLTLGDLLFDDITGDSE